MEVQAIQMTRLKARELYRGYKAHLHYSQPIDRECMRAFQLLAQGRLIIKAIEAVRLAGLNDQGLPKLALCRADSTACEVAMRDGGSARMSAQGARNYWSTNRDTSRLFTFARGSFPDVHPRWRGGTALLPPIPLNVRPARAIANYHILWEATWTLTPPGDPYLLRRIGKADLWLVVAHWDLTEVERAALATRLTAA
jgi:hypothetical protein